MKIGVKVGDIMTREYVSVSPDETIKECAKLMIRKRVGSLIIVQKEKLVGILTERDIIWVLTKKANLAKIKAKDIANKKVVAIKPSADLYEALQKMKKSKYRWLPVMIKGRIIGLLTIKDILAIEPDLFEIAQKHDIFQIREEDEKIKRRRSRERGNAWSNEGVCEECGNFGLLYKSEDKPVCESCMEEGR